MPTLTAAIWPTQRALAARAARSASASATQPPVIDARARAAVRLEHVAVDGHRALAERRQCRRRRAASARSAAGSRACGRPGWPLTDSRWLRSDVAPGSIAYSAVTQPMPLPRRCGGMRSSIVAAHSTCVSPIRMMQEPAAHFWTSSSIDDRAQLARRPAVGAKAQAAADAHRDLRSWRADALLGLLALGFLPQLVERVEAQRAQLQRRARRRGARRARSGRRTCGWRRAARPPGRCPACGPG